MTVVTLTLPLPPRQLSPNFRPRFWKEKADAVREYRFNTKVLGLKRRQEVGLAAPLTPPVTADILFVVKDARRRDLDNLLSSLKAGFDGMVDARLLEDDSSAKLRIGSLAAQPRRKSVNEPAHVHITLCGAEA